MTEPRRFDPARRRLADAIFVAAMDRPEGERAGFIEERCAGQPELLADVRALLRAVDDSVGFLETPGAVTVDEALFELDERLAPPPTRLGPYRLVRLLGRGGMGSVYLGERERDGFTQTVAIKLLRHGLDTADIIERFVRERDILGRLTHPGIARLIDGGSAPDGRPYLVMEFVDGEPITAWCDRHRLDLKRRLELFLEVADAVQAAHASLVVHRDLKPANILVADGRVKLLDFGIAKLVSPDAAEERTRTGLFVLTPEIASPEQLRGEPVTIATDVFQLGVLLHQLLAGVRPPPADPSISAPAGATRTARRPSQALGEAPDLQQVASVRATTVPRLRRALQGDLDTVVLKALHQDPARRYPSVERLADDVRRHLDGRVVTARPDTLAYRARAFARRHPWVAPAATAAMLVLIAYLGTVTWYAIRLADERSAVREQAERAEAVQAFLVDLFRSPDPYDPVDPVRGREITVVEALDVGVDRLRDHLTDRPVIRAALLGAIADVYQNLNLMEQALPLRQEALALQRARDPGSAEVVASLGRLTGIIGKLRPVEETRAALDDWLRAAEALDPPMPVAVAEANLGLAVHAMGYHELDLAERHLAEVLAIDRRESLPPDLMAEAYRVQSDVMRSMDALDAAREAADRALALRITAHGADAVETALARVTLAQTLSLQDELADARSAYEAALDVLGRQLGPDHRLTLVSRNALALLLWEQGDLAAAAVLLQALAESYARVVGDDDKLYGDTLQNLAVLHGETGLIDEARALHRQAAGVYAVAVGERSFFYALPYLSLAGLDLAAGRAADAERSARTALGVLRQALPEGHYVTAVAECRLGRALDHQQNEDAALPLLDASSAVLLETESVPGYRAECLAAAAEVFERVGRDDDARALRQALSTPGR